MPRQKKNTTSSKIATGIAGFDEITGGGLPRGRVSVVFGSAGSGKTIFALQTLVTGAHDGEPGLFVAFEESVDEIVANASHFNWDLSALQGKGVDFFDAQLSESTLHGGEFDLIGLLAMISAKAKTDRAKRIVFDGLDMLLAHLGDPLLVRREVFRLRAWLRQSGMTGIITAKADDREGRLSPEYNFLQFMSDCVVSLKHPIVVGTALRVLRVAKYRGDGHSANEYPFAITNSGMEVAADTSTELNYAVSVEKVSSGVERLDSMLRGGYYRGSSILISGSPGTAKTSLAAAFADAACRRKEPTLYVSFDEAPDQIVRNVASIGLQLGEYLTSNVLKIHSLRTRAGSPESHVARIRAWVHEHSARNLIVDPISALSLAEQSIGDQAALQVLDLAKSRGMTFVSSSLLANAAPLAEETAIGISSIADTWMHLSYVSQGGERNRALTIIKSRGTGHSNQVRELILSDSGIDLADAYVVGGEVLMGTMRWEREIEYRREQEISQRERDLRRRAAELALAETKARLQAIHGEQALREAELSRIMADGTTAKYAGSTESAELLRRRGGDFASSTPPRGPRNTVRS